MATGPAPPPALPAGVTVIDSHCHLDEPRFAEDLDAVIVRARAAGVRCMVTIGGGEHLQTNLAAIALARRYDDVFATAGVHPHAARIVSPAVLAEIARLAREPKVVAIGETGLDYHYDNSPRPAQQEAFRQFIGLARGLALPLVVHLRDAYDDALTIMREEQAAEVGGVMHCFSGDRRAARAFLDLGFDLSFSGMITFKNADELRAVARMVPKDRFMIETDAPFLTPFPHRGRRNEPRYVVYTAARLAAVRQQPLDTVAAQSRVTAERRFRFRSARP
ncbi:MAG: TatD family hydrolase [Candidatus Binatia bacterium]